MENGRFVTIILAVAILCGGLGYYGTSQVQKLNARMDSVQSEAESAEVTADFAKAAANEAKEALASAAAANAKIADDAAVAKHAADSAAIDKGSAVKPKSGH